MFSFLLELYSNYHTYLPNFLEVVIFFFVHLFNTHVMLLFLMQVINFIIMNCFSFLIISLHMLYHGYDVLGLLLQHIHFCHNLLQGTTTRIRSCKKAKTFISTILDFFLKGPPNTTTKTSIFKLENSNKNYPKQHA